MKTRAIEGGGSGESTLIGLIDAHAENAPDAIAVICGGQSLSYATLHRRSNALAHRLRTLGIDSGSRVAILAERSAETVVGILAILKAGGAYVPLDPEYPADLLAFTLADCGASLVLAPLHLAETLPVSSAQTVLLDDTESESTPAPTSHPDNLAYIIYTSGSTGRPKGVLVTHANLAHSTSARLSYYTQAPTRFLLLSSFAFDSSVAGLFWTLTSGGALVLPSSGEERDPTALATLIDAQRITHTLGLPSLHALLLQASGDLGSLETVIVAGENCPSNLPAQHSRRLPKAKLFNEYGPTEATVWSTVCELSASQPVTIGQPIAGTQIYLLDEAGQPVPDGTPGEIHIGGPGVARGYLNQQDLTASRFVTDSSTRLYKTGDLARRLPSGDIDFLGRADHQVKIRGYRIELGAIEAALQTHPAVREAAVLARDTRLIAYITPADCPIADLRRRLAEQLPAYMQPAAFVALTAFPLMPNGKVDRSALPAPTGQRPELDSAFVAPRTPLEQHLAAEWCAALELDPVGIHDKFFELGGDSLRAAMLANRLQQRIGEPVFVIAFFEAPTIAQLAEFLKKHYPDAIARAFGEVAIAPISRSINPATLSRVRNLIPSRRVGSLPRTAPKNRRVIFILAPPRSGTTLLRAMLARHPGLHTTSELRLLGFDTLAERRAAYSGTQSIWRQGPIDTLREINGCDAAEAVRFMEDCEHKNLTTGEFYALLQQPLAPRELVDKSPSYALDPSTLAQAEDLFEDAFYIHLARHPYEMIRSFESRRMDRIYLPFADDLTSREAGEFVWLISHQNILDFLATVPAERQCHLRFTDLVTDPRSSMEALCAALRIPFDPAVLDPYQEAPAAKPDGIHTADDPRFREHSAINPAMADGWRGVLGDNFLSDLSWQLADRLGYEKPAPLRIRQFASDDPIAIVGMAGLFPGARDVEAFWKNLSEGVESIRPFTADELRQSGIDPAILAEPGYVNAGAPLDSADHFAASFFGYTPREAELIDPQQRLFLECAWEAFEHAGCDVARFPGAIGVYAGLALNSYFQNNLATRPELAPQLGQYSLTIGNEKDFVATRVAHKLDLRGPAIGVQTACSSSLVALHLACQSLRSGEIDMALAGGGRIRVPLHAGYTYVDGGIPSPDGHCRAFDANARGCVAASGIATVVLKRLSDALRDGDRIFSVIKATAINNDGGDKAGFTAPGVDGQAEVIARAHAAAGITADTIGYVEAHGTGTSLGDPIEIAALTRAFRTTSDRTGHCRIGSVKTNIGHLDAGAGVAGLIKAALALDREVIPPSLHFQTPNPQIDFARSPFVVNAALTAWPRSANPRRAGVSSFGIGGTNAHAVLEEAPQISPSSASRPWQLLVLSAKTASALNQATSNLARHLRENPGLALADVAHTLQTGRREFQHRRIVVARDAADAADALENMDARRVITAEAHGSNPAIAFMFPGQGAQFPGMARELFDSEPVFRDALLRCAEILKPHLDLISALYPDDPAGEAMTQTAIAQPAIFAVEYAMARLWESWGIRPSAFVGHSVGEFTAACLADVFSLEDALTLLAGRARLMQDLPGGSMLALRLSESELRPHLDTQIELAAINSPRLCVVSGPRDAVAAFAEKMSDSRVACASLQTSHAFHSAMVEPMVAPFTALAAQARFNQPRIPIHSTLTGGVAANLTTPEYWSRQIRNPVRFADAVQSIAKDHILLEVGPGVTLAPLARQTRGGIVIASQSAARGHDQAAMLEALGRLWLAGVAVDWSRLRAGERRLRVPLPTYPFERERYWISPAQIQRRDAIEETPIQHVSGAQPATGDAVLDRLRALLHEMSGVPIEKMDAGASLLELGFDSLFLTQVALALRKQFGIEIAFRQLFEELSTLAALAAHLTKSAPPSPTPTSASQQVAFGPFRPIQKESRKPLAQQQQQHLDELAGRYSARTATSKRLAQENRTHFADPRAVSGFRPYWKELVYPIVVERSAGSKFWDADGNEYVDFTMGFGTNLLGHSPAFITEAIAAQLARGIEIGPQSPVAGEVARLLCEFSGMNRAAFCNTGSEAVVAAVRVARTVTGRDRIATCSGYHGINDEFLVRAKTIGNERRTVAIAPGIPDHVAREVLAVEYGSPESLEIIRAHAHELAAVLVEPVQSRHPDLQPRDFLHELRKITSEAGVALVFDEVITGFRCHPGGAQAWFGVHADLVTYGKIIGGGMPIGAVCGRAQYMDALDGGAWSFGDDSRPEVGVTFFAGTYVRHPLAMAASRAVLTFLKDDAGALQERLNERTAQLVAELNSILADTATPIHIESFGSMFILKFADHFEFGGLLFFHLREKGIHAWDNRLFFLSTAHTEDDLALLIRAFRESVNEMRGGGFFTATIPLTDAQRGLYLLAAMQPDASRAYNESSALELRGPLDVPALRTTMEMLVHRHEALRTSIASDGETQTAHPHVTIEVPLLDCTSPDDLARGIAEVRALQFDFARAPVMDARLLRLSAEHHVLLLTFHHILGNGPSFDVIFDELFALYPANGALPPAMQLHEFVRWRNEQPQQAAQAFWTAQFADSVPVLELPLDHPRPARISFAGAREDMWIERELATALRQTGAGHGASLFVTLLSAFQTLLHRLSGQDDLVVGVPFEGTVRALPGGDRLFANTTNLAPLRSRLTPETTFAGLLAANRDLVLAANEHQHYFFGHLIDALGLPFDPSRPAIVSVYFNYERGGYRRDIGGLEVELVADREPYRSLRDTAKNELYLNVADHDGALSFRCDYNRDLFDAETIRRWLGHLRTLLAAIAANPRESVHRLPLADSAVADARPDYPPATLPELFSAQVVRTPNATALVCEDERLTYAELETRAARLAAHLSSLGVGPEVIVALRMERSAELIVGLLAIIMAGGAYLPIDLAYPPERAAFMLADSQAPVLLTQSHLATSLSAPRVVCIDAFDAQAPSALDCTATADSLAYVIYTSGSTGQPKGCCITHHNVARLFQATEEWFRFGVDDVWTMFHSVAFDFSVWEIWGALLYGGRLVVVPHAVSRSPDAFHELLVRERVTVLNQTPSAFRQLIAADANGCALSLRLVIFGGEALEMQSLAPWFARHGDECPRLVNMYGITETTVHVTYRPLTARDLDAGSVIGVPIPDLGIHLLDRLLQPVPIGVPGEIYVAGAGLARGYLNRDELTAERFITSPFQSGERLYKTGDLARCRADGDIEYLGRIDQQVKIRGFRIELGEIQSVLVQHPGIREAAVIARTETDGDKRLIGYLVPDGAAPDLHQLRAHLKTCLPDYMVPAAFVIIDHLPLTQNGKLDTKALPEPGATSLAQKSEFVAPRNSAEERVAEVWRSVLKLDSVGVHDDFFDLGGHSLAAMQVVSRLRGPLFPTLNVPHLFEHTTVATLVETLRADETREEGVL